MWLINLHVVTLYPIWLLYFPPYWAFLATVLALINFFIAESVSFKVDKSGNGGSGSSGHGGSGNRDLGPEYRMPPRLEMLLDMPPVALEEQIKHAWNTEDRWEYNFYRVIHQVVPWDLLTPERPDEAKLRRFLVVGTGWCVQKSAEKSSQFSLIRPLWLTPKQRLRFCICYLYLNPISVLMSTAPGEQPDESLGKDNCLNYLYFNVSMFATTTFSFFKITAKGNT